MLKKWYSTYKHPEGMGFIIIHDPPDNPRGKDLFYLCIYTEPSAFGEDLAGDGYSNRQDESVQDTIEIAKLVALDAFGVPLDSWVEAGEELDALPV